MARGNAPRRCPGGGERIQATRQILARVSTALASLAGATGIGAALVLTVDAHRSAVGVLALAAVLVLALGLAAPFPSLLPWPFVALAGLYAWTLGGGGVDSWAPVYAGGVVAVAELAYWSIELRGHAQDAGRLAERRTALIAALSLVAVGTGGLVLAGTALRIGRGVATDLLGVAAAVVALAVVAALARQRT